MDDLTFRRRVYENPEDNSDDILEACKNDPKKAQFRAELQNFNKQLSQSLNIDVPENLSDRVLLSQSINFQNKQKKRHRLHLALAASVAFAIGISFQMSGVLTSHESVEQYAFAHLEAESSHFHDRDFQDVNQVNAKLASFGGELTEQVAPVTFSNYCLFGGFKSLHMIFQGEQGPVTVFVIPNDTNLTSSPAFKNGKYHGSTIELQNAQMLIITDQQESNHEWKQKLTKSINWQNA